ncbi:MAG: hypothetical protein LBS34_00385 [Rickettsiales bacterium]|nr:hypothetical protein [Rickettsiales bacterium]
MKKCIRTVFVSLLVVLTMGKSAWASSKGMIREKAMYYLKNTKGCICKLIVTYSDKKKLAERRNAERNLGGMAKHRLTRPIVDQAFDDAEREGRMYDPVKFWLDKFFAIRKTYLGR